MPSAATVAATPPPAVLDMGNVGGSALADTGATSGATQASASPTAGSAGSALPAPRGSSAGAPGFEAAVGSGAAVGFGAAPGSRAASSNGEAPGSRAAAGSGTAAGSDGGDSGANTTPSGSSLVDHVMSGPLPGASSSSLVNPDQRITVSMVQPAAASPLTGLISVSIPRSVVETAIEFRFPLPEQLLAKLHSTHSEARATLMNGKPLPRWLTFRPSTGLFVANSMPVDALPLEVLVRSGAGNWAVLIQERGD
jgi:hypothetical protein